MIGDPKPEKKTQTKAKCKVNNCLRVGDFLNGICEKCFKKMQTNTKKKPKPLKKQSNNPWSKAFRDAKSSFQRLRRVQEMDQNGICRCVNGEYRHWTKAQGGHWIPAKILSTCFESMNVHPQSGLKNRDMDNPIVSAEYTEYMLNRYGKDEVEKLILRSKQIKKYTTFELIEMKKGYDHLIRKILGN